MWRAFAVCVMQGSLTCQLEHSGKVRSGLVEPVFFKSGVGKFIFNHCYQVWPHFLCAALMGPQRTNNQI